ncbi:MAG: L,D-transpeptidase [candidate division KSB1 bacterium]|nr:L,D-transpeptidase [candidate division KSB1 bacterium]MDZ7356695.1 L,D-transpeptidase [candidate division KSB1 bacterium]MDZ7375793.1 L,D-transpeptidase [candidate division KSB1 bacterium]MDZ7398605.1 L,D-transpeptidase [candidate division KSB1 bacterium]
MSNTNDQNTRPSTSNRAMSFDRQAAEPQQPYSKGKIIRRALLRGTFLGILLAWLLISFAPLIRDGILYMMPRHKALYVGQPLLDRKIEDRLATKEATITEHNHMPTNLDFTELNARLKRLQRSVASLQQRVERLIPREPYLIIDTSDNLIFLMKGKQLLHQGICSTGSYIMLKSADGSEKWIFKTPRGLRRIQAKIEDPVWRMPDWAFIEEGLPVPEPYARERYEPGVLGDYALSLGDGYLIHGTLYQRFLGLPVTHGCVRLGDKELEIVYRHLQVGSKVFIY